MEVRARTIRVLRSPLGFGCVRQDNTGGFNDDKLKKVLCRDH
jgi:hypothetical protein